MSTSDLQGHFSRSALELRGLNPLQSEFVCELLAVKLLPTSVIAWRIFQLRFGLHDTSFANEAKTTTSSVYLYFIGLVEATWFNFVASRERVKIQHFWHTSLVQSCSL